MKRTLAASRYSTNKVLDILRLLKKLAPIDVVHYCTVVFGLFFNLLPP